MKKSIIYVIILVLLSTTVCLAQNNIISIENVSQMSSQGKYTITMSRNDSFRIDDILFIYDENGNQVGFGRVIDVLGFDSKRIIFQQQSGRPLREGDSLTKYLEMGTEVGVGFGYCFSNDLYWRPSISQNLMSLFGYRGFDLIAGYSFWNAYKHYNDYSPNRHDMYLEAGKEWWFLNRHSLDLRGQIEYGRTNHYNYYWYPQSQNYEFTKIQPSITYRYILSSGFNTDVKISYTYEIHDEIQDNAFNFLNLKEEIKYNNFDYYFGLKREWWRYKHSFYLQGSYRYGRHNAQHGRYIAQLSY